jgi:hypothetical protein
MEHEPPVWKNKIFALQQEHIFHVTVTESPDTVVVI